MATNLALDDRLINNAVKLGGHKSKRAAVTARWRNTSNPRSGSAFSICSARSSSILPGLQGGPGAGTSVFRRDEPCE